VIPKVKEEEKIEKVVKVAKIIRAPPKARIFRGTKK